MYDYDDWDEVDCRARDEIWTPEMLAERWRVSANQVRAMLLKGDLKGFKIGHLWRIYLSEIMKYETRELPKPSNVRVITMPQPVITRIT